MATMNTSQPLTESGTQASEEPTIKDMTQQTTTSPLPMCDVTVNDVIAAVLITLGGVIVLVVGGCLLWRYRVYKRKMARQKNKARVTCDLTPVKRLSVVANEYDMEQEGDLPGNGGFRGEALYDVCARSIHEDNTSFSDRSFSGVDVDVDVIVIENPAYECRSEL